MLLGGGEEAIDPWKPRLLAVIGVKHDGNAVVLGDLMDVFGTSNGSGNGGLVVFVVDGLTADELSASLGECDHDGPAVLGGGFHARIDGVGADNVHSGDGVALRLGVVEEVGEGLSSDNSRLDGGGKLGECLMKEEIKRCM